MDDLEKKIFWEKKIVVKKKNLNNSVKLKNKFIYFKQKVK